MMRTGPCARCGRTIDYEVQYCDQCEAEMDWLADHPGEELPDPRDEDPPDWLLPDDAF